MKHTFFWTAALLATSIVFGLARDGESDMQPRAWYVAVQGRAAGEGTLASPWDLTTALAGGPDGSTVLAGDTIWLRGGTYRGAFKCQLVGADGAPIIVRNYQGERVILDHAGEKGEALNLAPESRFVWIWGLEFVDSDRVRVTNQTGPFPETLHRGQGFKPADIQGADNKLINCIAHDGRNGIGMWKNNERWGKANNAEIYGCLSFNNGWHAPDNGWGHGVYVQNMHSAADPSRMQIRETIIWNNFAYGVHAYSEDAGTVDNLLIEGVISFNNGAPTAAFRKESIRYANLLAASTRGVNGVTMRQCYLYHPPSVGSAFDNLNIRAGYPNRDNGQFVLEDSFLGGPGLSIWLAGWRSARVSGNTLMAHGSQAKLTHVDTNSGQVPTSYVWNGNTYYDATPEMRNGGRYTFGCDGLKDQNPGGGATNDLRFAAWRTGTGFDAGSDYFVNGALPNRVILRPNAYEKGRAHIVAYNWEKRGAITVDLSKSGLAHGQAFEIRNVQNYFGAPLVTGSYDSGRPGVSLPMTETSVTPPIGFERYPIASTLPEFGAFVLLPR